MYLPKEKEIIQIKSYKHNGKLHRTWKKTVVLKSTENIIIGGNDHTLVVEADGRKWVTREPSICYFHSDYWFNVISMIREDGIYHYCNLGTPFAVDEQALKYIDYDLDIKVFPDGRFHLLDEGEYEQHRRQMKYPDSIDRILRHNVDVLSHWILDKKGP
ncbi:DUF402 domain-containing protein, partial [Listeria monocytogenes]|nr:DUF402 domain-containing protein [Listeria monocytogenes]EAD3448284.1 DUF402 domain-containing protein [Listeria monocytogenes]EAE6763028.1 DUF402 domain-containing protein [Listeria monocytogenes]EAF8230694.1 DUF402 domain-containing protein [Listeria monocytogenes]EAG3128763.1 DUF402 domain-containing protein [Listeria monocytogenes]